MGKATVYVGLLDNLVFGHRWDEATVKNDVNIQEDMELNMSTIRTDVKNRRKGGWVQGLVFVGNFVWIGTGSCRCRWLFSWIERRRGDGEGRQQ